MPSPRIFLDTSFLFPFFAVHDIDHERVSRIFEEYQEHFRAGALVTTNHVVFEAITLIRYRGSRDPGRALELAERVGDLLYSEKVARIHVATFEEEQAAFAYLRKHRDQKYSAVDCLSFLVMEKLGITEALAVDSDFTHRFTATPGPSRP
jgi:predicted nucleic acid-binding protein